MGRVYRGTGTGPSEDTRGLPLSFTSFERERGGDGGDGVSTEIIPPPSRISSEGGGGDGGGGVSTEETPPSYVSSEGGGWRRCVDQEPLRLAI